MSKVSVVKAFELVRDEAINRLSKNADYPGKLCEVSSEVSQLIMNEMKEFREVERYGRNKS